MFFVGNVTLKNAGVTTLAQRFGVNFIHVSNQVSFTLYFKSSLNRNYIIHIIKYQKLLLLIKNIKDEHLGNLSNTIVVGIILS